MGTMPRQRPHRSEQSVETDPRLIAAVTKRFGPLVVDLAANGGNTQAPVWLDEKRDSLSFDWLSFRTKKGPLVGNRWLNPPFADIAPWAAKCVTDSSKDCPVLLHVPASTGSNWFRDHVYGKAYVLFLNGRVTYIGHTKPYPKDTIIAIYGRGPGDEVWTWQR